VFQAGRGVRKRAHAAPEARGSMRPSKRSRPCADGARMPGPRMRNGQVLHAASSSPRGSTPTSQSWTKPIARKLGMRGVAYVNQLTTRPGAAHAAAARPRSSTRRYVDAARRCRFRTRSPMGAWSSGVGVSTTSCPWRTRCRARGPSCAWRSTRTSGGKTTQHRVNYAHTTIPRHLRDIVSPNTESRICAAVPTAK